MHSTGHVPYAPDFFFVGTGFAGAFLLEVCRLSYLRFGATSRGHYSSLLISFSARTPPRRCLPNSAHRLSMCARSSWRSCGRPLLTTRMHRTRMLFSSKAHCKRLSSSLRCPLLQPDWQETEPVFFVYRSSFLSSCQFIYATHFIKGIVLLYMSGMLLYVQYISRHHRRSSATCLRSSFVVHGPSLSFPSTHTHFFIPPSPRDPSLDVSLYLLLILSMPAWKYLFFFFFEDLRPRHYALLKMHRLD